MQRCSTAGRIISHAYERLILFLFAFLCRGFVEGLAQSFGDFGFFIGAVVGALARFLVHYIVGATVWAEYMPETFFGMTMHSPWFYSLLYNGSFMLADLLLCLVIGALLYRPLRLYIRGGDLPAAK